MCHEVRRGGREGGRGGGAGEFHERLNYLPSESSVRPDCFIKQRDGLRRDRRGDGAPGVGRAKVEWDGGRGGAAGRRGGRAGGGVSGRGISKEGDDVQKHEEAQRRQEGKEAETWWSCHACAALGPVLDTVWCGLSVA